MRMSKLNTGFRRLTWAPRSRNHMERMTERADGRHLLLIGMEGLGLQSLQAAVADDPSFLPIGRLADPDAEHTGAEPHLVVVDTSHLSSDIAVSSVAKAVLR